MYLSIEYLQTALILLSSTNNIYVDCSKHLTTHRGFQYWGNFSVLRSQLVRKTLVFFFQAFYQGEKSQNVLSELFNKYSSNSSNCQVQNATKLICLWHSSLQEQCLTNTGFLYIYMNYLKTLSIIHSNNCLSDWQIEKKQCFMALKELSLNTCSPS